MRRFSIVEPETPTGPPLGYQVSAAAYLRAGVEGAFRELGVNVSVSGSHIDGDDLHLYISCSHNRFMLIRFLPNPGGTRIQFYLPLKKLPDDREATELAASTATGIRVLIAGHDNTLAAVVAEFMWRGEAGELIEHLGKIGSDLEEFLDLRFITGPGDD